MRDIHPSRRPACHAFQPAERLMNPPIPIPNESMMMDLLKPGRSSDDGFLDRKESLQSVLDHDNKVLQKMGVTHQQIADRLTTLIEKWKWRWHETHNAGRITSLVECEKVMVEGKYLVSACHWMGYQDCPVCTHFLKLKWEAGAATDCDYTVWSAEGDKLFVCSGLLPHLISKHHFFEGHTSYRVDPAVVIKALGIKPGMDCTPKWEEEKRWLQGCSSASTGGGKFRPDDISPNCRRSYKAPSRKIDDHTVLHQDGNEALLIWQNRPYSKTDKNVVIEIDGIPFVYNTWNGTGWAHYEKTTCRVVKDQEASR